MLHVNLFSVLKPIIPRRIQIALRRMFVRAKLSSYKDVWPIDPSSAKPPAGWQGWPDGKKFALVLTHDVDTQEGHDTVLRLAEIEEGLGFRSSFNFVAKDFGVSKDLIRNLQDRGFEVGVHGINHENPFKSKKHFQKLSPKINHYLKEWNAVGFRAPSMYHNLDMLHSLNIEYDASTFDTDPFEPQPDGVGTIFPFWVPGKNGRPGYVELPYTLPQDFLLFILLQEKGIDIWKKKLDWIAQHGGMALFITHSDYMDFHHTGYYEKYPYNLYEELLGYIKTKYEGQYWQPIPRDIASFWKEKYKTKNMPRKKNLNVCMLTYSFYKTDARVRRYAEILARRGDHVEILSLKDENDKTNYEILNDVHIYRLQRRLKNEKGKFQYFYRILKFLIKSFVTVTKNHIKKPYDLIHVHSVPDFEVFAALLPKLLGSKIILDIHDPVPDFFLAKFGLKNKHYYNLLSFIERISTGFADHVITVTDFWSDKIAYRSQIPENKISVILNLPDLKTFDISKMQERKKAAEYFTVIYPGTINKHCGLDIAVRAIALAKETIPNVKFDIYGDGPERNNIISLIKELKLDNNVFLKGRVPLEMVPEIMYNADIGIALLSGDHDYAQQALNVKLFEYLSMELPAVATRTKSIEHYLKEGTIMLSKPNDPDDVAKCIIDLYLSPSKREALQKNGLAFIREYNSETQMKKYLEIIDNLVLNNL